MTQTLSLPCIPFTNGEYRWKISNSTIVGFGYVRFQRKRWWGWNTLDEEGYRYDSEFYSPHESAYRSAERIIKHLSNTSPSLKGKYPAVRCEG